MWKFEIPALLQSGSICLVFLVKIRNDQIRTEGGVAFKKKSGMLGISGNLSRNLKFWLCYRVELHAYFLW